MSTSQTFPLPSAPSISTQRVMKRRALKPLSGDALYEVGIPSDAKDRLSYANDPLVAIGIEDAIARAILDRFPEAHRIEIFEDISHDAPHGHIGKVLDERKNLLIDGTSEEWHNLEWTRSVDEDAWDFHYYAYELFTGLNEAGHKAYLIPSRG